MFCAVRLIFSRLNCVSPKRFKCKCLRLTKQLIAFNLTNFDFCHYQQISASVVFCQTQNNITFIERWQSFPHFFMKIYPSQKRPCVYCNHSHKYKRMLLNAVNCVFQQFWTMKLVSSFRNPILTSFLRIMFKDHFSHNAIIARSHKSYI